MGDGLSGPPMKPTRENPDFSDVMVGPRVQIRNKRR